MSFLVPVLLVGLASSAPEHPPEAQPPSAADSTAPSPEEPPPIESTTVPAVEPMGAGPAVELVSPPAPTWDELPREIEMAAAGGLDVCEALSLPLSLIPGVGGAVGTVSEWLCLVPAAIAVDTVAVHFGDRDAAFWQSSLALLSQKLFEDLLDTPLYIVMGAALLGAVGVGAYFALAGLPVFLPTVLVLGTGTLLAAPVALAKAKGGDLIFDAVFFGLTRPVQGQELIERRAAALFQPGHAGWARPYVLMAAAAGSKSETELSHLVPLAGPMWRAANEATVTKERMRRVGRDVLRDPVGRDLSTMDAAVDVITTSKGITRAIGEGLAIVGLGVGITGAVLPAVAATDQQTGDTVGFVGLGIVIAGVGVYALSTTADTLKTLVVPCAYGCFE